jgi:hypothetical protein
MKLPNAAQAVVEIEKLCDYCLSTNHPRGRHKARVFATTLGIAAEDAEDLRNAILSAVLSEDAVTTGDDQYGNRYVVDFTLTRQGRQADIRTT